MLLSSIMALFTLFLYRMAWAFMEAGEKTLTALILPMPVFIRGMRGRSGGRRQGFQ
jgi:hypothetical protein